MARTKQEIRNWLDSQVGKKVNSKAGVYNGQCVSLIKALLEFLGAPDPYKARGNAKDAGNNYIKQGIGTAGRGWLTVCVNPSMGRGLGHIWVDLLNEANYGQNHNGDKKVHKNDDPISGAKQFVNLDQWVKADAAKPQPKNYTLYGMNNTNKGDFVNSLSKFMYATFPKYTDKKALGSYFGPYLTKSIKEFQRRTGLSQDGVIKVPGGETYEKLKSYGFKG